MVSSPLFTVADLFCGCGALSYGLAQTGDFDTVLGVDNDPEVFRTFLYNHIRVAPRGSYQPPVTLVGDIRDFTPISISTAISTRTQHLDVLVGGPPCEGFSTNNVNNKKKAWNKEEEEEEKIKINPYSDPRNDLFRYYLNLSSALQPKVIVIENVPQMLSALGGAHRIEIEAFLEGRGYHVESKTLNTADYGVPQERKRAIVIATRKDVPPVVWPSPTHATVAKTAELKLPRHVTVRDAISDLPAPDLIPYASPAPNAYAEAMRSSRTWPTHHIAYAPSPDNLARLKIMRPGMVAKDLPATLTKPTHYRNAYGRMEWDLPSHTITSNVRNLGSGRFSHPEEDRGVTMREAARLQSFPDDFDFLADSMSKTSHLLGSAVPPLFARALAVQISKALRAART